MSLLSGHARLEQIVVDLVAKVATLNERVVDLENGRSAADRLSGDMRRLGERLDAELEKFGMLAHQVVTLDRKVENGEKASDAQRRKLVALAKSVEWETESLRKGLELLLLPSLMCDEGRAELSSIASSYSPAAER